MKDTLPVRRSAGLFAALRGDTPAKEVAVVQEAAFIERAHDAARRDLAHLRMNDVAGLAHAGIDHAGDVADHVVARIERNPYAAHAVSQIAESAVSGLAGELRRYIVEGRR
jgi:hypothetical protein